MSALSLSLIRLPKRGQRKWLWLLLASLLVAVFAGGLLWLQSPQGISLAKYPLPKNQAGWTKLQPQTPTTNVATSPKASPPPAPPAIEKETPSPTLKAGQVAVVFSSKQPTYRNTTVARTMAQPSAAPAEKLKFAVEALLKGPNPTEQAKGALTEIPSKTRLLSIEDTEQGLLLNLSEEFLSNEGAHSMQRRLEQLAKTVQAVESERPVYLRINHQPLKVLGNDGLEVDGPLNQASLQQGEPPVKP
jgi:spore germination protein GerM